MRFIIASMVAATGLLITSNAFPADMAELAKKHQCNACHAIDKKIVGPSWMEVSKAYNSNGTTGTGNKVSDILAGKTAEEWLVAKISEGGFGNWGTMPMPAIDPNGANKDDIRELVKAILGLAKAGADLPNIPVTDKAYVPAAGKKPVLESLSNKYQCSVCHDRNKRAIGPSWMEVSKAYNKKGKTSTGKKITDILRFDTAEKWLLLKISEGGTGNWGSNIMPASDPNYQNEADIAEMARLILDLGR